MACSNVTIKNEETLYSSWRRKPSRLHKSAAKMIAKIGKYFFTRRNYDIEIIEVEENVSFYSSIKIGTFCDRNHK